MIKKLKSSPLKIEYGKRVVAKTSIPAETKSPGQLLEDLIGVLSNRKELLEKIIKKFPRANDGRKTFIQYLKQTKKMLAALLTELSDYGDGLGGPDPQNEYNAHWMAGLKKWDTINHHRLVPFWRQLETILILMYKKLLEQTSIPASFQKILTDQLAELELSPG